MKLWQKFAVALTTATLLYGGQLRMWTDARNRFLEHWNRSDALSLLAGIAALALLFTGLRELFSRHRFLRKVADHVFILILGTGAVSAFLTYADYKTELIFLGLVAVATASWMRPGWQLPRRAAVMALIFSPATLILGNQLLRYPDWIGRANEKPATAASSQAGPVFVFVFDEWSYDRSTEKGELLPLFKHLGALARQSWTFDFAQSAGPRTDVSLPRFLWQRTDDMVVGAGDTYWSQNGSLVPTRTVPSLFSLASERGYHTILRGFYLPYRHMLGEQVDSCTSYLEHPKADTFGHKMWANGLRNLGFQHDPISRRLSKSFENSVFLLSRDGYSRHWELINRKLRNDTLGLISQAPANTFAVVHFPLPHCPWVFRPDGTYAGPYTGARMSHDVEGYRNHLAFLDLVIGQFLDAMRRAGKFDAATIVITSDHSWRLDSTFEGKLRDGEQVRHVPLFIKLPGQKEPGHVSAKFELTNLKPLLEAVLSGHTEEAQAALAKQ